MRRARRHQWLLTALAALLGSWALVNAQQPAAAPPPNGGPYTGSGPGGGARVEPGQNLMSNPYRMIENWPTLNPGMKWGAAINFLPDNKGGTWALLRTEPPISYFDAVRQDRPELRQGHVRLGRTACAAIATATSGRATAGRSPTSRAPPAAASWCSSSARRASCC